MRLGADVLGFGGGAQYIGREPHYHAAIGETTNMLIAEIKIEELCQPRRWATAAS